MRLEWVTPFSGIPLNVHKEKELVNSAYIIRGSDHLGISLLIDLWLKSDAES